MNRILIRVLPLLIFLGLSHLAFEAKACSCDFVQSVYQEYHDAAAVFVGKVIGERHVQQNRVLDSKTTVQFKETIFQFEVIEAFKGVKAPQIEISVGEVRISCFHTFGVGATYLVYAFDSGEKPFRSTYCSRTAGLRNASADLHYIRDLLRGVPEPRVYGSVRRREVVPEGNVLDERATPLAGMTVLIEGEEKRFEVVTDEHGLFRLDKIPDGAYKARPLLPDDRYKMYLASFEEFVVGPGNRTPIARTDPRKAVTLDFHLAWNTELQGRILDAEGTPVTRAKVAVLHHRDPAQLRFGPNHFINYFEGKFGFDKLSPGRYLLSVSIGASFDDKNKSTTFYYPSSQNIGQAEVLEIATNQKLEGKDIQLPAGYVMRQIKGVVVYPDGNPASQSKVLLTGSKDSVDEKDAYDTTYPRSNGIFSLQAFVGAEYWVYATNDSSGKGEAVKVKVEMTNEPLKLVIPFSKRTEP